MNTVEERLKIDIIHKLTLLDTSSYRCVRLAQNNVIMNRSVVEIKEDSIDLIDIKEPNQFRSNLFSIYKNLSLTQLQDLYNMRKGDY